MAKQKVLEVEGRAEVAWDGTRDERQREKLCLGAGGNGTGKQKWKSVRKMALHPLTSLLGLGVGSMRLGLKEAGDQQQRETRARDKGGGMRSRRRQRAVEHTGGAYWMRTNQEGSNLEYLYELKQQATAKGSNVMVITSCCLSLVSLLILSP